MDYKAILNIMKEMNQTELTKLEIEEEGIRICMEKGTVAPVVQASVPQPMMSVAPPQAASVIEAVEKTEAKEIKEQEEIAGKTVVSPMVGTFYSQPSPEKPAFVKVGDKIKKGQTLCIIEAMKLMNEIESEEDGEIIKILVKDEEMVEYGQPLFIIK